MHIVANKAGKNPAAATLFSVMKLPIADINAENAMMHEGHASEADINGHVDGWISPPAAVRQLGENRPRRAAVNPLTDKAQRLIRPLAPFSWPVIETRFREFP